MHCTSVCEDDWFNDFKYILDEQKNFVNDRFFCQHVVDTQTELNKLIRTQTQHAYNRQTYLKEEKLICIHLYMHTRPCALVKLTVLTHSMAPLELVFACRIRAQESRGSAFGNGRDKNVRKLKGTQNWLQTGFNSHFFNALTISADGSSMQ